MVNKKLSIDEVYSCLLSQGGRRCVDIQLLVATITTSVARNWRLASINQATDGCRLTLLRWYGALF